MKRRGAFILFILSMACCLALTALWFRSVWCTDLLTRTGHDSSFTVLSSEGRIRFVWEDQGSSAGPPWKLLTGVDPQDMPTNESPNFFGFAFRNVKNVGTFPDFIETSVPFWFPLVLSGVVCFLCRPRLRSTKGRCPSCGYDLRATPTQCPECGEIPPNR
jgi:hypothetical protein